MNEGQRTLAELQADSSAHNQQSTEETSMSIDHQKTENVITQVRKLIELTKTTGFITSRSQRELLATLNPAELAAASDLLHDAR